MDFPDCMIHLRLGELRLVKFIVPEFSVADDVQHNIFLEFRLIADCQRYCSIDVFNVLSVDMDDGDVVSFEEIC
jgi:hypothetical protein